jgi:DNA gyrase subunit A
VYDLPDGKASGLGEYLANVLGMESGERIVYMVVTADYGGYMLFGYENGKLAKVPLSGYATKFNRKKLVNAYSDKSKLVAAYHTPEDCDMFLTRGSDKAMLMNTALLSPITSRNTAGVQVFSLRKNTKMNGMRALGEMFLANGNAPSFSLEEMEYYRVDKVPSAGHFLQNQMKL